ncbi:uncharacterized protein UV8b_07796 [Ustilaginoidea virens]|uniref:Cyanovirin-N domain-containing protein n=1 Tax=Ustilaginoidea virens TaxID=1159556 RepID=A0A8E5HXP6_USTVR|nr:uncharacterized protein UV8b_07796 [Ustilaginoidea virens]QUC23555.1 hypothetical protein UV8b_07796 [Ustilaginoidea virens]
MKITAVAAAAAALAPALVLASPRAGLDDALSARDARAREHMLSSRDPRVEHSCTPLSLSPADHETINAKCINAKNQYQATSIDLSHCLMNSEGTFVKAKKCREIRCLLYHVIVHSQGEYIFLHVQNYLSWATNGFYRLEVLYNYWGDLAC